MLLLSLTSIADSIKINAFLATERTLQPEGLLHSRGMAASGFPHCAIFPTAASRRSLDRVSVPVWLVILSDQLEIDGLVSHYLTNYLISLGLILWQVARKSHPFLLRDYAVLATVSSRYPPP